MARRSEKGRVKNRLGKRPKTGYTINELAEDLSLHRNTVLRHLAALEAEGVAVRKERQYTGGRGQPPWIYALAS